MPKLSLLSSLVLITVAPVLGQDTLQWPVGEFQSYPVDTGLIANPTRGSALSFATTVNVPGASWIRLYYGAVELEPGSTVRVTSVLDNEVQELDAAGLAVWSNTSAYFNGDTVYLEVVAGPETFANRIVLDRVAVFVPSMRACGVDGCGYCGADDRVPSGAEWSGRLMPVGCTGSVYNEYSCVVTAGHCVSGGSAAVIQFNVPSSLSNCSTVNPPVADQFPITGSQYLNEGVGADWGVLTTGTNNLGQRPYDRYGVYRPIAAALAGSGDTVAVWGYGVDDSPSPTRSQIQQTSSGTIGSRQSTHYTYNVDVTYGNSGSGLLKNDEIVGIVTHCSTNCANIATRIDLPAFLAARDELCPLTNDLCANALLIYDGTYDGTTVGATQDGTATCGSSSSTRDVWYRYPALGSGTLTVQTCTADYNTALSIHTGCPGTTTNQVGCNDNSDTCGAGSTRSYLAVPVTAGLDYYIRVSGRNGASGTFTLVASGPADATPPIPSPMTFETAPTPNGLFPTTVVDMVAARASDPTKPVQYTFEANTGPAFPGADSRAWGTGRTYSDMGLTPNTVYVYRTQARDAADPPNETALSAEASTATHIETPEGIDFGSTTTSTIEMTVSTPLTNLDIGLSGVFFESPGSGGLNEWVQTLTDTATDLDQNTEYVFRTMARNQAGVETPYSNPFAHVTAMATPTGVTFGATTATSIALNVSGDLLNLNIGQSGIYFDETTDTGDVGINEWVQTTTDTASPLTPDTNYSFRVRARNQSAVQTDFSGTVSKRTLAADPDPPILSSPTATSIHLQVDPGGNPASTLFAVQCMSTDPADANWDGRYVNSAGGPSETEGWQTAAAWGELVVSDLQPDTTYTFAAKARNGDGVETALGIDDSLATLSLPTGACCHPVTGACTIESQTSCTGGGRVYQGDTTSCSPNPCPPPAGACCFTDGTCTVVTQTSCTSSSGTYQGDWTDCDPNPCPQPTGACCDPSTGDCTVETQVSCTGGGWIYQGDFSACTPNPCEQPCLLLGDLNVDGVVNGLDIGGFVRAKLGEAPFPGESPICADYGGDLNSDIADFVADLLG